jgi:uroporphyrinogen-III synthase
MKLIAIMRPAGYLAESVRLAASFGFTSITAPMIDVIDRKDANFNGFVNRIMEGEADYVIFTSANGVEFTLLKLKDPDEFIERLNKTQVVAIGPKTRNALLKSGIRVSIVPESYSSEGLVGKLSGIEGSVIEIARSSHGAPELVKGLLDKGAVVHETQVYQIISPRDERHEALMKRALAGDVDIFAFTSTLMVKNFMALAKDMGVKDDIVRIMNEKMVAAIGKPTYDTLEGYGINVKVMPKNHTFEELLLECKKNDC